MCIRELARQIAENRVIERLGHTFERAFFQENRLILRRFAINQHQHRGRRCLALNQFDQLGRMRHPLVVELGSKRHHLGPHSQKQWQRLLRGLGFRDYITSDGFEVPANRFTNLG
jgi:hypothetical protein